MALQPLKVLQPARNRGRKTMIPLYSRMMQNRAASDNVTHGTWIVAAVALGVLSVGALAIPGGPVHHWLTCQMKSITDISGATTVAAQCGSPSGSTLPPPPTTFTAKPTITPITYDSSTGTFTANPGWTPSAGDFNKFDSTTDQAWVTIAYSGNYETFAFTVDGPGTYLSYGIPSQGYLNNSNYNLSVNGTPVTNTTQENDPVSSTNTSSQPIILWTQYFPPGTYTVELEDTGSVPSAPSINLYGYWLSNPSALTPTT